MGVNSLEHCIVMNISDTHITFDWLAREHTLTCAMPKGVTGVPGVMAAATGGSIDCCP